MLGNELVGISLVGHGLNFFAYMETQNTNLSFIERKGGSKHD